MSLCSPDPSSGFRRMPVALVAGLLLAGALLSLPAPSAASGEAPAPSTLAERFNVEVSSDGIELTPLDRDSAVESIELLDGENEALVNGKPFSRQELEAFLGADGKAIAELLELSDAERRAAVGYKEPSEEVDESDTGLPPVPDAPGRPRPPHAPFAPHIQIEGDGDDRISFGQWIHIEAGDTIGDAVCIGCSITVSGTVEGDAVSVGGRIELEEGATIGGNAVSVGGRVDVPSGATVEGDAVAVGGKVFVEEGGAVEGQKSSVGWGSAWFGGPTRGMMPIDFSGSISDLFWSVMRTLLLMLIAAVAVLFLRGSVERTSRRVVDEPWRALFGGLLTQLLFFPVLILATVVLAVSIIGIPLLVLVPVAIVAFFLAMVIGFVAVAQALGRWGRERFGWHISEPYLTVIVGVVLIQIITIVGRFIGLFGMVGGIIGVTILLLGFFLKYVAWTMGLGGMTLSLLARDWRRPVSGGYEPPPPPPLAPIDFTRDDAPAAASELASDMAETSSADEVTESVDEADLRARGETADASGRSERYERSDRPDIAG
jgi:hypothetical protein